ncbi:MAG: energy transducer TonB [Opitutales bacterium]
MSLSVRRLGTGALLFFLSLPAPRLSAQSELCVEHNGKSYIVHKMHGSYPYVLEQGKLVAEMSHHLWLSPAPEFLPVFVTVTDWKVNTSGKRKISTGEDFSHEFHFQGAFTSFYTLHDVFLVLELDGAEGGQKIFSFEVGEVGPNQPRWVRLTAPLKDTLGKGLLKLHLFANGVEVFHSEQPPKYREEMLDQMVSKKIGTVADAMPKPFVGPAPNYPETLLPQRIKGQAVVKIRITPKGVVLDPVVESATNPAFGEAALAVVRQWRFLPRVKNGQPVETTVSMPFAFAPPEPADKS